MPRRIWKRRNRIWSGRGATKVYGEKSSTSLDGKPDGTTNRFMTLNNYETAGYVARTPGGVRGGNCDDPPLLNLHSLVFFYSP
jgi:hypothetical protein